MRPSSGRSKPAIRRSVVVLPEPDGPSSVKNSPAATSRSTSSTATTEPNDLRSDASRTSAGAETGAELCAGDSRSVTVSLRMWTAVLGARVPDYRWAPGGKARSDAAAAHARAAALPQRRKRASARGRGRGYDLRLLRTPAKEEG